MVRILICIRTWNLEEAVSFYKENQEKMIDDEKVTLRSAARRFEVTKSVLDRRLSGKTRLEANPGRSPVFTKEEED